MIKEIAFVYYPVKEMARARRFYEETLELKPGEAFGENWIEYDVGGGTFAITDMFGAAAGESVAFEVDDFSATLERLKAANVTFKGEVNDFPSCQMIMINDPDGNSLCIHQRKS